MKAEAEAFIANGYKTETPTEQVPVLKEQTQVQTETPVVTQEKAVETPVEKSEKDWKKAFYSKASSEAKLAEENIKLREEVAKQFKPESVQAVEQVVENK